MMNNQPQYPVYIISKGRWDTRWTAKALDVMKVKYFIAVEPQEYDNYKAVINSEFGTVLELPFSNHGKGSGPSRNWCWEHSKLNGHKRHWILDDNIHDFWRFTGSNRFRCDSGSIFRAAEDFCDRYENVYLASMQYKFFVTDNRETLKPFIMNTRVMSCILIQNNCIHKWRGKYNEDVDLSIRVLKDGGCTVVFNAFLCDKAATQTCKGGNTEELYGKGTFEKSKMLVDLHPDIVTMTERYGRWHHQANLSGFANNKFIPVKNLKVSDESNEYGMKLFDHNTNQEIIW